MSQISQFLEIINMMYRDDDNPPHFHAKYGDFEAEILINELMIRRGQLPPRVFALAIEWASKHQQELIKNWELDINNQNFNKIALLV